MPKARTPDASETQKPTWGLITAEPICCEAVKDPNGERLTILTFDGMPLPLTQSADKILESVKLDSSMLMEPISWFTLRPWLKDTPEAFWTFWMSFYTGAAEENRIVAWSGVKAFKSSRERSTAGMAKRLHASRSRPDPAINPEMEGAMLRRLGEWVMHAINVDPGALKRLEAVLKPPESEEFHSIRRKVFDAFAKLVAKNEELPTKKQVREMSGISPGEARTAFKALGLNGLRMGG